MDFQKTPPFGEESPILGAGPWLLAARADLRAPDAHEVHAWEAGGVCFEVRQGRDALWLIARPPRDKEEGERGAVAFRLAWSPDGLSPVKRTGAASDQEFRACGAMGTWRVRLQTLGDGFVRWTTWLTPEADLLVPFWPRDVYPVNGDMDPCATGGTVHATQNNTGVGLLYLSLTRPRTGSLLYVQNLTALNGYCQATHTEPGSVIGGDWPELGLRLPVSEQEPLPAGRETVLSDALVRFSPDVPADEREMAGLFLDLLNDIYPHLDPPETEYHDWPGRAAETVRDLRDCDLCSLHVDGHVYLHPFVDGEPPDSLTQINAVKDLRQYEKWVGREIPMVRSLWEGVPAFYNNDMHALMRYVPGCQGPWEKEGDSWYHYVSLAALAVMAQRGDEPAQRLLFGSLDWAIRCARYFDYRWPVMFDVKTFKVLRGPREPGEPGQPVQPGESDVGGIYAYVMMVAHDLTGDEMYLREAENAVHALDGFGFNVVYETSVTAWGALGALKVWKTTGDRFYLDQSYMLLAGFLQNAFLWESDLGPARHFPLFFGVKAMFNIGYKASYEILDAFSAFLEYLRLGGEEIRPSVRALLSEFCRHSLHTTWYAYPCELPADILAETQEYGKLDRNLMLPLEDLSAGWEKVGRIGQQVYGANASFVYLGESYLRLGDAPFILFVDVPFDEPQIGDGHVTVRLHGDGRFPARIRLIPKDGRKMPEAKVSVVTGKRHKAMKGRCTEEGHLEYLSTGDETVLVEWTEGKAPA